MNTFQSIYEKGMKYLESHDYKAAFDCFLDVANKNNSKESRDAKYYLASMYYAGKGTAKDINKACDLLKELALSDDKDSFLKLYSFANQNVVYAEQKLDEILSQRGCLCWLQRRQDMDRAGMD